MNHLIYYNLILLTAFSCNPKTVDQSSSEYKYNIIQNVDKTYGYTISESNNILIIQKNIPGFEGIKGFEDSLKAKNCALIVLEKLSENIFPPTVSKDEINKILNSN